MDKLYTFWDNIIHYKPESVHLLGLMNSATKKRVFWCLGFREFRGLGVLGSGSRVSLAHNPSPC